MEDSPGPMGCVLDEAITDSVTVAMQACGQDPIFTGSRPELAGNWSRLKSQGVKAVLLPRIASAYFPDRPADYQRRGTCVARGTYRAAWLSYLHSINAKLLPGKPIILAYEPIYGGSRVEIGKGRIGGDGSVGAWAADWLRLYGACERAKYQSADLSEDTPTGQESIAVEWGSNGIPADVEAACKKHPFRTHRTLNVEQQMDAVSGGYAGAFCRGRLNGSRDKYGMSRPAGSGAHCEAVVGVFVAHNGEDAVLMQQSWGNQPSGPAVLKMQDGEFPLPQGCYGLFASDQAAVWKNFAESWHFEPLENSSW